MGNSIDKSLIELDAKLVQLIQHKADLLCEKRNQQATALSAVAIDSALQKISQVCQTAQETPAKIAFLGPSGTFSEQAAQQSFPNAIFQAYNSIESVFRQTEAGHADFGIVPVENSTEGSISITLDLLIRSPLNIHREVLLPIRQCLMARSCTQSKIQHVYGHEQSLAQARQWLNEHLPHAERIAVASNSLAASLASQKDDCAALGCQAALKTYPTLQLVAANIEDQSNNTTCFLILGSPKHIPPQENLKYKTSLILSVANVSGAIYQCLQPFASYGISLSKLQSRPIKHAPWEYMFFIDLLGHRDDMAVSKALQEIQTQVPFYKLLGSYPQDQAKYSSDNL